MEAKNRALASKVDELGSILRRGLTRPARIDATMLYRTVRSIPLELGDVASAIPTPDWQAYAPTAPGVLSRAFGGGARYERELADARSRFGEAQRQRDAAEADRQRRETAARADHARLVEQEAASVREHNEDVDEFLRAVTARHKDAVERYLGLVLSRVPLPEHFPHRSDIAFSPQQEQVVVRFELPARDVVPQVAGYQYLSTKDEERPAARKAKEISDLYRAVISQVALLCVRDLFTADPKLAMVGFNGHVYAVNPATGVREFPCMVSLNVGREDFPVDSNLRQVTAEACVRHLKAIVSNHPYDLEAIEPILDFDLSKYSFVDGLDAVATLDSRPDLLEMSATNFEHLVRQLFEAQGLDGWTTQQSNDDGVDAVIANKTSIVGGLAIVQAKRYSIAVGVNHIRELAGAIEEKKAGKGILVTTSWFTAKCWEKAREHGRMELIDGERLKFLIKEHLGKDVLIGITKRPKAHQSPNA